MILEPRLFPYDEINKTFHFGDLITGGVRNILIWCQIFSDENVLQGWLAGTELFYGSYCNHSVHMNEGEYYSIPDSYFFTTAACYLFTVVVLSIK